MESVPRLIHLAAMVLVVGMSARPQGYRSAQTIAHLEDANVSESSGVVASRINPGIYWTHNDSGDGPTLYAFDLRGKSHGRWRVPGANAVDWEDIAIGPGPRRGRPYLYIGDIGDNARHRREVVVYRVPEPPVLRCTSGCTTAAAFAIRLRYPDGPHNAEALCVHPVTGDLYIITKAGGADPGTGVYRAHAAALSARKPLTLARIATLNIPDALFATFIGGITGADISPDGRRVVLCDYFRAYEARVPRGAFDAVWGENFAVIPIGIGLQVEGVCYRPDGKALIATSEGRPCPVFEAVSDGGQASGRLSAFGPDMF